MMYLRVSVLGWIALLSTLENLQRPAPHGAWIRTPVMPYTRAVVDGTARGMLRVFYTGRAAVTLRLLRWCCCRHSPADGTRKRAVAEGAPAAKRAAELELKITESVRFACFLCGSNGSPGDASTQFRFRGGAIFSLRVCRTLLALLCVGYPSFSCFLICRSIARSGGAIFGTLAVFSGTPPQISIADFRSVAARWCVETTLSLPLYMYHKPRNRCSLSKPSLTTGRTVYDPSFFVVPLRR